MKKEFEFILKDTDLKYQPMGASEFIFAKKLILKAPSVRQERIADKLSQMIMQAIKSNMSLAKEEKVTKKKPDDSQKKDYTSEEVMMMLKMSDIDFSDIKDRVKELLFDGCCFIDGTLSLRQDHYDKIEDLDTANNLIGEYLANFLFASLFSQKN